MLFYTPHCILCFQWLRIYSSTLTSRSVSSKIPTFWPTQGSPPVLPRLYGLTLLKYTARFGYSWPRNNPFDIIELFFACPQILSPYRLRGILFDVNSENVDVDRPVRVWTETFRIKVADFLNTGYTVLSISATFFLGAVSSFIENRFHRLQGRTTCL